MSILPNDAARACQAETRAQEYLRQLAALRADLDAARQHCTELERTIDAIDVLTIPSDVAAEHTRQVGGPVSGYLTAHTEPTVIQHVKDAISERDRQIRALRCGVDTYAQQLLDEPINGRPLQLVRGFDNGVIAMRNHIRALLAAPAPAPDDENRRLRDALEKIESCERWMFIDTPLIEAVKALQETVRHLQGIARAALAPAPDTKGEGEADDAAH